MGEENCHIGLLYTIKKIVLFGKEESSRKRRGQNFFHLHQERGTKLPKNI